jgi:formylglycine-generating enzyme required for sulfatase activity
MGTFDVKAFAIEMVSNPTGAFYVGDGSTSGSYSRGGSPDPVIIGGNGQDKGNTYSWQINTPNNSTPLNYTFPTGYYGFYMMKYELSNAGYRDFLNTLTYTQQTSRMSGPANSPIGTGTWYGLNNVEIATPGVAATSTPAVFGCDANGNNIYNEANDGEWVSVGAISVEDMYAYLDWSALRPMTDLEFEKACRGPLLPLAGQYAWGTVTPYKTGTIGISGSNQFDEIIAPTGTLNTNLDSTNFSGINRPLRNGIFATSTSSRSLSGAGYYGAMELTGNLCELTINCYNAQAVTFDGSHGDGNLGLSDHNTTWPVAIGSHTTGGGSGSIVTMAFALNARGGSYYSDPSATIAGGYGKVSYLIPYVNSSSTYAPQAGACSAYRIQYYGIRGVRNF